MLEPPQREWNLRAVACLGGDLERVYVFYRNSKTKQGMTGMADSLQEMRCRLTSLRV